jgi:L-ascorbate metabolism protein UlaG (beta-lactamase superfamily)
MSIRGIETSVATGELYVFSRNNPFDRYAPIQFVVSKEMESRAYMESIHAFQTPADAIAIWFLGQNGFILKGPTGPLIGIDLYLTNSCAATFAHLPFRLDRQLPVFIEPDDLEIDVFITTHSHDDHADPETLRRMPKLHTKFIGPFDSMRVYRECGIPETSARTIHPGETIELGGSTSIQATFSLPTDSTDLNHTGVLCRFGNGITFYNTGDTAYAEILATLLPTQVDICAICINGGFHNLAPGEAAAILKQIHPKIVVPCHYDMMINNVGSPEMLRVAMDLNGSSAPVKVMRYYEPWLYRKNNVE